MQKKISGIHHVTAIASIPQRNLDFYTQVLGMRLVKLTVNFDAPDTYHFYFADEAGRPGSILTFFPWPNARQGTQGTGQASMVAFSIPPASINFWVNRLNRYNVRVTAPIQRFDDDGIVFFDPDGLMMELVASKEENGIEMDAWQGSVIPPEMAFRGFHSVGLIEDDVTGTAKLLTETFGFRQTYTSKERIRFEAPSDEPGRKIDLIRQPGAHRGWMGSGAIHHIAWRAADDAEQLAWREDLVHRGLDVTPVIDRQYFHSIYFREPGGVLFEIATDLPGFMVDEDMDCLGTSLKLPSRLEPRRDELTRQLPALKLPVICPELA